VTNPPDQALEQIVSVPTTEPDPALQCPKCGYQLEALTTSRCPECGTHFTITGADDDGDCRANSYIALSVLALLICGIPGIIPLVYSVLTLTANSRHDYAKARRYSRLTSIWLVIGFVIGGAIVVWLFSGCAR
jgi:Zn finger protein HypA/HybF involved in hydrogenase expression